jgi:alkanesulfonate monooxygenase SsuD/methylene tetrahydromethanopterin reductase-like flavin-dependent oxidoreductase (luciferase family)
MSFDLRFQVLTLPSTDWPTYRDQVKQIEALGFDVAAVPDHFCDWANPPAPWLEAWTCMAGLAEATSTVRLATCVTQIPLRHPGVLAHQATTADQISGGRIELGLGAGITIDPSLEMIGLENWSNGERADRFGEYIELVGLMLSQPVTSYQGKYYRAVDAVMNPSSVQDPRVPLVAAALAPKMMGHTARFADTWNTMSFDADFDAQLVEVRDRVELMDKLCEQVGRDPKSLRRSFNIFDAEARTQGGRLRYYEDPDLFTRLVTELTVIGFTDIGVYYPTLPDQIPSFEKIANDVIPGLRAVRRN